MKLGSGVKIGTECKHNHNGTPLHAPQDSCDYEEKQKVARVGEDAEKLRPCVLLMGV